MIIVSESHKIPNFHYRTRPNTILNCLNILRMYHYTLFWNNIPQKRNRFQQKCTLRKFRIRLFLRKDTQNSANIVGIIFLLFWIKQNITNKYYHEWVKMWLEHPFFKLMNTACNHKYASLNAKHNIGLKRNVKEQLPWLY